jgi:membrane protein involved in colicin uptake
MTDPTTTNGTEGAAAQTAEQKAADKAAKKAADKAARDAKREASKADKAKKKADAKAAREAARLPRQNGVRRPKAETKCGQAWAIFDSISEKNQAPASIGEAMVVSREAKLNDNMVRSNYAAWRKYHGVTGRIVKPTPAPAAPAETPAAS